MNGRVRRYNSIANRKMQRDDTVATVNSRYRIAVNTRIFDVLLQRLIAVRTIPVTVELQRITRTDCIEDQRIADNMIRHIQVIDTVACLYGVRLQRVVVVTHDRIMIAYMEGLNVTVVPSIRCQRILVNTSVYRYLIVIQRVGG